MPRNKYEGIAFSFIMSFIMIYVMAALNYGVRTGDFGRNAWAYAVYNFIPAYVIGMCCDLLICSPLSRKAVAMIARPNDRPIYTGFIMKFCMVIFMTIVMTLYGIFAAVGFGWQDIAAFFTLFPYNFTIALPIQMLLVAPFSAKIVRICADRICTQNR